MSFETFDHTADVGLRITAPDLDRLFADAARGLFSLIVPDLGSVEPRETVHVDIEGEPSELLLFDWLNELLYIFETRRLLLAQFDVKVSKTGVSATARGERIDDERHQLDHELKAITYHGLKLERQGEGWLAEVIVDILRRLAFVKSEKECHGQGRLPGTVGTHQRHDLAHSQVVS